MYIETSSNTLSTEKSEIVEDHYDVAKILFKSHNVFEGSVYEFIPQGAGQLFLGDGTGVTYKVTINLNRSWCVILNHYKI